VINFITFNFSGENLFRQCKFSSPASCFSDDSDESSSSVTTELFHQANNQNLLKDPAPGSYLLMLAFALRGKGETETLLASHLIMI
jgi:hypothetical protein